MDYYELPERYHKFMSAAERAGAIEIYQTPGGAWALVFETEAEANRYAASRSFALAVEPNIVDHRPHSTAAGAVYADGAYRVILAWY